MDYYEWENREREEMEGRIGKWGRIISPESPPPPKCVRILFHFASGNACHLGRHFGEKMFITLDKLIFVFMILTRLMLSARLRLTQVLYMGKKIFEYLKTLDMFVFQRTASKLLGVNSEFSKCYLKKGKF